MNQGRRRHFSTSAFISRVAEGLNIKVRQTPRSLNHSPTRSSICDASSGDIRLISLILQKILTTSLASASPIPQGREFPAPPTLAEAPDQDIDIDLEQDLELERNLERPAWS